MSSKKKPLSKEKAIELFYKINFFKDFNSHEKERFAEIGTNIINYETDEEIITEGELSDALFILLKGSVYITQNSNPKVKIAILKPGAVFGEISFLAEVPRTTNTTANSDVIVLKLNRVILEDLGPDMEIKIRDKLIKILIAKLDKMNKALLDAVRFVPEDDRKHLK